MADTALQLRSLVTPEGRLELSLARVEVPTPADDEVLVRVEASPINPSDLGLLFGPADMSTAEVSGPADDPVVTATIPEALRGSVAARVGQSLPVGNEGAGVVVGAGSSDAARALMGRTVGLIGGAMYSQFRAIKVNQCLPMPEGTKPTEAASCFVNPLTALGMVETMRLEGHRALVHTAAASNLGQMLNRLCIEDGVPLVNIVRKPEQEQILRGLGAKHVLNSSAPDFMDELVAALATTGATLAFDAIGGGRLASQILTAMERALTQGDAYNRYGSSTHKQVYIYGSLDRSPTELARNYGMAWSVGGWLLTPFLQEIGPEGGQRLRQRVADEIKTTFASSYSRVVSLAEALSLEAIRSYGRQATGEKFLIDPNKGL
jgi:NADPH2:quinone reductase